VSIPNTSWTPASVTKHYSNPFGTDRGSVRAATGEDRDANGSPGDRGFLGKSNDTTGLVHVGARYYDSSIGAFVSPDPVLDSSSPGQLNAYAYSYQNPVTFSDPSGLYALDQIGGGGGGAAAGAAASRAAAAALRRLAGVASRVSAGLSYTGQRSAASVSRAASSSARIAAARAQAAARAEAAEMAAINAAKERAAVSRANARYARRKIDRDDDGDSRPVIFMEPRTGSPWNPGEEAQIRQYVAGSNEALRAGLLSPTGRVGTAGIADAKKRAVNREKARCPSCYPKGTHPGHVPDTTWTGKAEPPHWQALTARVNWSLGSQAGRYSIGYEPTSFWYYKDYVAFYGGLPGE